MYFSELFLESDSNEAFYNGEKIYSCYHYEKKGKSRLKFKFINSKNDEKQCIIFMLDKQKDDCKLYCNSQELKCKGNAFPTIDIFDDSFGKEFVIDVEIKKGVFSICNGSVTKIGNKEFINYMDDNYAMKIEKKGNIINFKCNSDQDSSDFNDLEFEIELLED